MKAATYCRMSTLEQDDSIQQQTREIEKLAAAQGYKVVATYQDEGWSGDDEDRPGFQEMLNDAQDPACPWQVVLVWDLDRFSRSDARQVISDMNTLGKAGISIHSCQQGRVDLSKTDIGQLVLLVVTADQNHQYLKKLAPAVVRGMLSAFKAGRWLGKVCYGYREIKEAGKSVRWEQIAEQAEVVRWIFDAFVNQDLWYARIAYLLNQRGLESPGGGKWRTNTVQRMLANEKYAGDVFLGKSHFGKHAVLTAEGAKQLTTEEINRLSRGKKRILDKRRVHAKQGVHRTTKVRVPNASKAPAIMITDAISCPIISRALWNAASKKIKEIKDRDRRQERKTMPLSGIAVCGLCDGGLSGTTNEKYLYYKCIRAQTGSGDGTAPHKIYSIEADLLHEIVVSQLTQLWLTDDMIEAAVASVVSHSQTSRKTRKKDQQRLQKRQQDILAEIAGQEKRALVAPENIFSVIEAKLVQLKQELLGVRAEMASLEELSGALDLSVEEQSRKVREKLYELREGMVTALGTGNMDALRAVFRHLLVEVRVFVAPRELSQTMKRRTGRTHSKRCWDMTRSEIRVAVSLGKEPISPASTFGSGETHSGLFGTLYTNVLIVTQATIQTVMRQLHENKCQNKSGRV